MVDILNNGLKKKNEYSYYQPLVVRSFKSQYFICFYLKDLSITIT